MKYNDMNIKVFPPFNIYLRKSKKCDKITISGVHIFFANRTVSKINFLIYHKYTNLKLLIS